MKTDKWFKENGFIHKREVGNSENATHFVHYYRLDPSNNRIGQKIKYHFDDSSDCYYVKWQMWTGSNSTREFNKWYPPLPERKDGIKWECETANEVFHDKIDSGYIKAIEYIKEHSEEKFKLLRNYMKEKGHEA